MDEKPFKYSSVIEMYGDDYLGVNPIFPEFINYGDWEGIDFKTKEMSYESRINASANLYRRLLKNIELEKSDSILEVACGNGRGAKLIYDEFSPTSYIGIDLTKQQVDRAHKAVPSYTFKQANAQQIPLISITVDKIISVEAIQHFDNYKEFLSECFRVLRVDGKLAICSFFKNTRNNGKQLDEMFPSVKLGIDKLIYIKELENYLTSIGFKNIDIQPRGKYVWEPFVKWCYQVQPEQTWSKNWLDAYNKGLIDYFNIYATKA